MQTVTEANLELRLQDASKPLLVDFSASWCRPCRLIERSLTLVEEELAARVDFVKVDVDGAERLARKFGICAVPTLVLHAHGRTIDTVSGVFSAAFLREWIEQKLQQT